MRPCRWTDGAAQAGHSAGAALLYRCPFAVFSLSFTTVRLQLLAVFSDAELNQSFEEQGVRCVFKTFVWQRLFVVGFGGSCAGCVGGRRWGRLAVQDRLGRARGAVKETTCEVE